jgi:hypothetical protein
MTEPKAYLYIAELAQHTPWTKRQIINMIHRGQLKLGEHYFRPGGAGSRPIFSWKNVVEYIEGTRAADSPTDTDHDSILDQLFA